jgi:hypothetical protein
MYALAFKHMNRAKAILHKVLLMLKNTYLIVTNGKMNTVIATFKAKMFVVIVLNGLKNGYNTVLGYRNHVTLKFSLALECFYVK